MFLFFCLDRTRGCCGLIWCMFTWLIIWCRKLIKHLHRTPFEDDPLVYLHPFRFLPPFLSGASADVTTRCQAVADVLQALVGGGYESEAAEIIGEWTRRYQYRNMASPHVHKLISECSQGRFALVSTLSPT